jgi:hypothetical protein
LISKKLRDSLARLPGLTGMGESRPLDSDLAARVKGNASGGAGSPESSSRGGALPDFTEIGARGSIRGAAWPGRTIAASVIYRNCLCGVACSPKWGGNGCQRVRVRVLSEREPEPGSRGGWRALQGTRHGGAWRARRRKRRRVVHGHLVCATAYDGWCQRSKGTC